MTGLVYTHLEKKQISSRKSRSGSSPIPTNIKKDTDSDYQLSRPLPCGGGLLSALLTLYDHNHNDGGKVSSALTLGDMLVDDESPDGPPE